MKPAAALSVGTRVEARGMRGTVIGFTRNCMVVVTCVGMTWFLDPIEVWSLPIDYNFDVRRHMIRQAQASARQRRGNDEAQA